METISAYHGTEHNLTLDELIENDSSGTFGIHFGSKKAAYVAVNKYDESAESASESDVNEFFESNPECLIDVTISGNVAKNATDSDANSASFLNAAIKNGFDVIEYENEFEDIGSKSYVVLNTLTIS